jgi:hypothetical protein
MKPRVFLAHRQVAPAAGAVQVTVATLAGVTVPPVAVHAAEVEAVISTCSLTPTLLRVSGVPSGAGTRVLVAMDYGQYRPDRRGEVRDMRHSFSILARPCPKTIPITKTIATRLPVIKNTAQATTTPIASLTISAAKRDIAHNPSCDLPLWAIGMMEGWSERGTTALWC